MQQTIIAKISTLFFVLFFSVSASALTSKNQTVEKLVQKYIHAYEDRDLNTITHLYATNAIVIGTGKDEVIQGRKKIAASFKRDFAQSTQATISAKKIAMSLQGNFAIASYYIMVHVKMPNSTPFQSRLRLTLGLLKENNQWVIVQSHLSAPLENQKMGESFPHA